MGELVASNGRGSRGVCNVARWDRIRSILLEKNSKNSSHLSGEACKSEFGGGATASSIVLKRVLEFWWLLAMRVEK